MRIDARRFARRARGALRRLTAPGTTGEPAAPRLLALDDIAHLPREAFEQACRASASPLHLGEGVGLCRILGRYKLFLSTGDDGFGANVLLDGYWESWLTQFIARTVAPGTVAVDVGANFGYYSLLLADLVGPEGRLHAIEPNPSVAPLLRRSVALNGFAARTTIWEVALAAGAGTATLFVPEREPKNATILADSSGSAGERHEVALRRLDRLLESEGRIDFIKIDAEGAEEAIIEGMSGLFAKGLPAMVLEFNAARYTDAAGFLDRLVRLYGSLRHVDYEGRAVSISPERVLADRPGEDWLLFLSTT